MKKKKKRNVKKIFIIIVIIALIVGGIFIYKKVFDKKNVTNKSISESKKIDSIKGFDYTLYDNSTQLYKDLYKELKEVLEKDDIDYEKYAELVSKMFVADFYNLNNKVTNQDVGGLDFIYSKNRDNFKMKATDTLYKQIESNVYGERKQDLPEVAEFGEIEVTNEKYSYSSDSDDKIKISISDNESYVVKINWEYKQDLNYQKSATIRLVHEDKVLSIISVE